MQDKCSECTRKTKKSTMTETGKMKVGNKIGEKVYRVNIIWGPEGKSKDSYFSLEKQKKY